MAKGVTAPQGLRVEAADGGLGKAGHVLNGLDNEMLRRGRSRGVREQWNGRAVVDGALCPNGADAI
eukprot:7196591-Alexandrium_andersonii.AAC.1